MRKLLSSSPAKLARDDLSTGDAERRLGWRIQHVLLDGVQRSAKAPLLDRYPKGRAKSPLGHAGVGGSRNAPLTVDATDAALLRGMQRGRNASPCQDAKVGLHLAHLAEYAPSLFASAPDEPLTRVRCTVRSSSAFPPRSRLRVKTRNRALFRPFPRFPIHGSAHHDRQSD